MAKEYGAFAADFILIERGQIMGLHNRYGDLKIQQALAHLLALHFGNFAFINGLAKGLVGHDAFLFLLRIDHNPRVRFVVNPENQLVHEQLVFIGQNR